MLEKVRPGPAFVFDAGAIRHLRAARALLERHQGRIVITPHAGEMAGLMGLERNDVEAEPARAACQAASELYSVVALKGALTFVATPRGEVSVCREGNVGLATSGSGDVLAGVVAGLLASGAPAFVATRPASRYLSFSAILRCSLRCGSSLPAQAFSSESSPLVESFIYPNPLARFPNGPGTWASCCAILSHSSAMVSQWFLSVSVLHPSAWRMHSSARLRYS
jgi:hypothetical protein